MKKDPNRIDFDPFPWNQFAIWIMTQMKRWGQLKGDVDYAKVAADVYLATDTANMMKEMGLTPPDPSKKTIVVMGKAFDPAKPNEYVDELRHQAELSGRWTTLKNSLGLRAALLSLLIFAAIVGALADRRRMPPAASGPAVDPEYAKLVGAAAATGTKSAMPTPADIGVTIWKHLMRSLLREAAPTTRASASSSPIRWAACCWASGSPPCSPCRWAS